MPRIFHSAITACCLAALGLSVAPHAGAMQPAATTEQVSPSGDAASPTTGTTTASTLPAPSGESLTATITGIEGNVQVRTAADAAWQKAQIGMVLNEEAELRTGPRSAVRFTIPPDQTITVDRLGLVKVLQAVRDGGKFKTKIGMKYGRTRYEIEAAGQEHESSISSPSSTLAVRGTVFSSYDQRPFPAQAVSLTGRVMVQDAKKRVFIGSKGGTKAVVDTEAPSAAEFSLSRSFVDPGGARARTASEVPLINTLLSRGSTVSFDLEKGIKVIRGGTPPQTDADLVPVLPGVLNFVLRWTNDTDLNLGVISPTDPDLRGKQPSTTVYPVAGLDLIANGGKTGFDHRGGPKGGIEVVYWGANYPLGLYRVGSQLISGPNTPATLDVFLNGQRVDIFTSEGRVTTNNFIAGPVNPKIANGQGIGLVRILERAAPAGPATPASLRTPSAKRR